MNLKSIIGMEIHVELDTKSKMFCGCPAQHFQVKPNTHTCPVCLGLPGALPIPNKKAIDWTILTGLALECQINKESTFDRKHYFYPDLPKGFQISQYDDPFCINGKLQLNSGKTVQITRVHLEEDTGKLIHKTINNQKVSLVDFNRSGVPLMEIVTEPDINSGTEAKEFLKNLRDIIRTLKVSSCDMDKGSMRLEANISLKGEGIKPYKVEVKNLNSFRFVEQAINYELERQSKLLKKGIIPQQETRGFNSKVKTTFSQRSKEAAEDYRYFPEPDIPPIVLSDKEINAIRKKLPKLPDQQIKELDLPENTAKLLVKKPKALNFFKENIKLAMKLGLTNQKFANFIVNQKLDISKSAEAQLKKLTQSVSVDDSLLESVIKQNPEVVKKFKAGKTSVIGFLVGEVMKISKGKADPKQVHQQLFELLS